MRPDSSDRLKRRWKRNFIRMTYEKLQREENLSMEMMKTTSSREGFVAPMPQRVAFSQPL